MASIDQRIVSMVFQNTQFEAGVAKTQQSLATLDASLAKVGKTSGFGDIEKAANKVTLQQPVSALDKLKARFSRAGDGASQGMNDIERAGNKVHLEQPVKALNKVQAEAAQVGRGAPQAFSEIESAAGKVSLHGLSSSLDSVTAKFSVLQGAASVALGNIASQGAAKAFGFAKSFGVGPIIEGLHEYETNLKSIQTVQANTDRPLTEINASLEELNEYSDQTIYKFSEMAKNIGTFTAAGVDLQTATSSIKGIANLAALSGSSSQQAATAMYQLSQAISSGRVGLQDWNSVVNAGMGGKKLQTALTTTAVAMGKIDASSVKLEGPLKKLTVGGKSFRESIMAKPGSPSWLESDILVNTLATLDGRFSRVALSAELTKGGLTKYTSAQVEAKIADSRASLEKKNGVKYTDEQFKALMKLSDSAYKSATEVKTLGQVFSVAREVIGSGWAASFTNIFGTLTEAKKTFTELSNTINGFIRANALARNEVLAGWKKMGGRTAAIEGIKNVFKALFAVLGPIGKAFRDVFPKKTADDLVSMSKSFRDFTAGLKPSEATMDGIRRTARGFFAVLHIGFAIVKGIIGVIGDLAGSLGEGGGGFLNFTGSIGDFLVAVDNALTKGGLLNSFFNNVTSILKVPLQLLTSFAGALFSLFGGAAESGAGSIGNRAEELKRFGKVLSPVERLVAKLKDAWKRFTDLFDNAKDVVSPYIEKIRDALSAVGKVISGAFSGENTASSLATLQTGLIGGIFLSLKKMFSSGGAGLFKSMGSFRGVLGELTTTLQNMQQQVKAKIIFQIALAIGILALSLVVLAQIDAEDLAKAMTAIATGLVLLMTALTFMTGKSLAGAAQLPLIGAAFVILASAMVILAAAMKIFATMSWEELAKGLAGLAGGLSAIALGMKLLGPGTLVQGPALLVLAIALNILALAVKQFASMSLGELAKGIGGIFAALLVLIPVMGAFAVMGPGLIVAGAGLLVVSFAMNMLAGALKAFGSMSLTEIAKGLGGIFAALLILMSTMEAFVILGPGLIVAAAGLFVVGVALGAIAGAIKVFGSMSIAEMAKGLVALAGSLVILAYGLYAMTGTLPGAAALLAAAVALALLAPTLAFLGTLQWSTIFTGLAAIGLALGTLAVAGLYAGPGLAALGTALLPLAGVFLVAAVATLIFAKAMQLLGTEGTKGIAVMVAAITAFVAVLPNLVINFIKGLVEIVGQIAKVAPSVVAAMVKILDAIIQVVIQSAPAFGLAIGTLINTFLVVFGQYAPRIIEAGFKFLGDFLRGINSNLPQLIVLVGSIVTRFLSGLATQAPRVMAAGARLIVAYLQGIANHMPQVIAAAVRVAVAFLNGVARGAPQMIAAGARVITSFLRAVGDALPRIIRAGVRVITKFIDGVSSQFDEIAATATRFVTRFFRAFGSEANTRKMVDAGFKAAINVLRGIAQGIRKDENLSQVIKAATDIGVAIVEGVAKGLAGLPKAMAKKLAKPVKDAVGHVKRILESDSPSKVFENIGVGIVDGMGLGLRSMPGVLSSGISKPLADMLRENHGLKEFGKYLGKEFQQGLTGGLFPSGKSPAQEQIEGSFTGLRDKLTEQQDKLQEQVKAGQDKLKELLNADPKGQKEIEKNQKEGNKVYFELNRDKKLLEASVTATSKFMASLKDEQKALIKLAYDYEGVSAALEKAKTALTEAIRVRDDAVTSYSDQYSQLPNIGTLMDQALAEASLTAEEKADAAKKKREEIEKRSQINQVALYKQALRQQIVDTQKYMETLKKLRAAGLDDTTYKSLLAQGTAGQAFASQLLAGGKAGIEELNKLNTSLAANAAKLAKDAATSLYQAGVDAAVGLVKGLTDRQSEIRKVMENIASSMVKAIKRQLGIRSPSSVFAEIGKFAAQGMANGLNAASGTIIDTAAAIGDKAADVLSNSLADISDRVAADIDTDLTITPVLDLTQVQKDAAKMQDLTNVTPITAATSYGQAAVISEEKAASEVAQAALAASAAPTFNYEQHNHSPEALSNVEIYRQTKNQLSQVKSALGLAS